MDILYNNKLNEYKIVNEVKRESYGAAFYAIKNKTNFFIRIIPIYQNLNKEVCKRIFYSVYNSIQIQKSNGSRNFVFISELKLECRFLFIETKYYEKSLEAFIESKRNEWEYIPENTLKLWLYQAIVSLNYYHHKGMYHGHIKLSSFFVDDNALIMDTNASNSKGCIGYLPPETYMGYDYTTLSDIFALGCVFYTITTLVLPFISVMDLYGYYCTDEDLDYPDIYSKEYKELIHKLLIKNEKERPTLDRILESPEAKILFNYKDFIGIETIDKMISNNTLDSLRILQLSRIFS